MAMRRLHLPILSLLLALSAVLNWKGMATITVAAQKNNHNSHNHHNLLLGEDPPHPSFVTPSFPSSGLAPESSSSSDDGALSIEVQGLEEDGSENDGTVTTSIHSATTTTIGSDTTRTLQQQQTPPQCGVYRESCSVGTDCCSKRCDMNQCQKVPGCSICGVDQCVGAPEANIALPGNFRQITCGQLETELQVLIVSPDQCAAISSFLPAECGCGDCPTEPTPSPAPIDIGLGEPCDLCGLSGGGCLQNPADDLDIDPPIPCGLIELAGIVGLIPSEQCVFVQVAVLGKCGGCGACTDSTPVANPTPTPVAPIPSPLPAPVPAPVSPEESVYSFDEVSNITYTTPGSPNWPSDAVWTAELGDRLSPTANLINNMFDNTEAAYQDLCESPNENGFERMHGSQGVCMATIGCEFQFCNTDGKRVSNLPAYTVEVKTVADISTAVQFAARYAIPVSVKTSGHNFHGASVMKDSLNIWMVNFPEDGTIQEAYTDSCGKDTFTTLGINGGQLWDSVLDAIGTNYHVLSGDTRHVSAAGGWLQGVGLSHTSRTYGLGVDNVVSFDVVLPSGEQVLVDACTNADLFWALRGGGGGTFGVVTHVEYLLHPATRFVFVTLNIDRDEPEATRLFLDWWTRTSPNLPRQYGGAWFEPNYMDMYIVQDDENLSFTWDFVLEFERFVDEELAPAGFDGDWDYEEYKGFTDFVLAKRSYRSEAWYDWWTGAATRLIPRDAVVNDRDNLVDLFTTVYREEGRWGAYWLGGIIADYDPDGTAVHPVMRTTEYSLSTGSSRANRLVRERFPNDISGSSANHQSPTEPDWRIATWGTEHYRRLLGIKNRYDPNRVFNCWHCVGYQGEEFEII